jgi:hypothetical protein
LQHQNDSLNEEFDFLLNDTQPPLSFCDQVIGLRYIRKANPASMISLLAVPLLLHHMPI